MTARCATRTPAGSPRVVTAAVERVFACVADLHDAALAALGAGEPAARAGAADLEAARAGAAGRAGPARGRPRAGRAPRDPDRDVRLLWWQADPDGGRIAALRPDLRPASLDFYDYTAHRLVRRPPADRAAARRRSVRRRPRHRALPADPDRPGASPTVSSSASSAPTCRSTGSRTTCCGRSTPASMRSWCSTRRAASCCRRRRGGWSATCSPPPPRHVRTRRGRARPPVAAATWPRRRSAGPCPLNCGSIGFAAIV